MLAAETRQAILPSELQARLVELRELPARIERQLKNWNDAVQAVAACYRRANNFLFLGRGVHYAVAREGALKLKESAYLHAEGYPSGELRHGPNALVSDGTPLVMIATVDRSDGESIARYRKVVHLMHAMREQGADILALANPGDELVGSLATKAFGIRFGGKPLISSSTLFLESGSQCEWEAVSLERICRVRNGNVLHPYEWKAKWIAASKPYQPNSPLPLFRREFLLLRKIVRLDTLIDSCVGRGNTRSSVADQRDRTPTILRLLYGYRAEDRCRQPPQSHKSGTGRMNTGIEEQS